MWVFGCTEGGSLQRVTIEMQVERTQGYMVVELAAWHSAKECCFLVLVFARRPKQIQSIAALPQTCRCPTWAFARLVRVSHTIHAHTQTHTHIHTHSGAPPPVGQQGSVISFDHWASARSHAVQQVIRAASGDARLMNPMAYVESHPAARCVGVCVCVGGGRRGCVVVGAWVWVSGCGCGFRCGWVWVGVGGRGCGCGCGHGFGCVGVGVGVGGREWVSVGVGVGVSVGVGVDVGVCQHCKKLHHLQCSL